MIPIPIPSPIEIPQAEVRFIEQQENVKIPEGLVIPGMQQDTKKDSLFSKLEKEYFRWRRDPTLKELHEQVQKSLWDDSSKKDPAKYLRLQLWDIRLNRRFGQKHTLYDIEQLLEHKKTLYDNKDFAELHFYTGEKRMLSKRYTEAQKAFKEARQAVDCPKQFIDDLIFLEAEAFWKSGDIGEATELYKQVLTMERSGIHEFLYISELKAIRGSPLSGEDPDSYFYQRESIIRIDQAIEDYDKKKQYFEAMQLCKFMAEKTSLDTSTKKSYDKLRKEIKTKMLRRGMINFSTGALYLGSNGGAFNFVYNPGRFDRDVCGMSIGLGLIPEIINETNHKKSIKALKWSEIGNPLFRDAFRETDFLLIEGKPGFGAGLLGREYVHVFEQFKYGKRFKFNNHMYIEGWVNTRVLDLDMDVDYTVGEDGELITVESSGSTAFDNAFRQDILQNSSFNFTEGDTVYFDYFKAGGEYEQMTINPHIGLGFHNLNLIKSAGIILDYIGLAYERFDSGTDNLEVYRDGNELSEELVKKQIQNYWPRVTSNDLVFQGEITLLSSDHLNAGFRYMRRFGNEQSQGLKSIKNIYLDNRTEQFLGLDVMAKLPLDGFLGRLVFQATYSWLHTALDRDYHLFRMGVSVISKDRPFH